LPDTSLTGQPLKADTFASFLPNSNVGKLAISPELSGGARQTFSQTTVDQEQPDNQQQFLSFVTRPIPKPPNPKPAPTLRPLQLWEGTIIECQNGSFVALVNDRTDPLNPDELVTFESVEVSKEDMKLIQPGASFYWTVGVERSPAGQIRNVEMLNFRRLPGWNASSVREAEQEAREIADLFASE